MNNSEFRNPNSALIRVLLVDDSPIAITVLKRIISRAPDMEVVGTASNGKEGLTLARQLEPTVICTDLHMPVMDGFEFVREVMANYPCPILVLSVSVREEDPINIFRLLEEGAIDVFPKPQGGLDADYEELADRLIREIRVVSGVTPIRKRKRPISYEPFPEVGEIRAPGLFDKDVIAIGSSTGGPQTLSKILPSLPSDFRAPILCVQHIGEGFLEGLVSWLSSVCNMEVRTAGNGERPMAGTIYFPREGHHMKIDSMGNMRLIRGTKGEYYCPSVDVTFKSVAEFYGKGSLGILLTGMGKDGAEGLQAIQEAGGLTVAQDEASSIVFGMPHEAIEIGAAQHILSPDGIVALLGKGIN